MSILSELEVGPDKIHLIGDEVTVFAMRAMPDWTVREFCQVPIYFQDKKYYLKRKTAGPPPYAFQYQLAPWHSELGAESTRSISYDEAYVAHREEQFRSERRNDLLHPALLCIYPLLGLCWSRFKERFLGPRGFEPVSITEGSILFLFAYFHAGRCLCLLFSPGVSGRWFLARNGCFGSIMPYLPCCRWIASSGMARS